MLTLALNGTMASGVCKIYTYHVSFQFTFFEDVVNVTAYYCSIFHEQLRHLGLREPNGFIFKTDIYLGLAIIGLIYHNFVFFHYSLNLSRAKLAFFFEKIAMFKGCWVIKKTQ